MPSTELLSELLSLIFVLVSGGVELSALCTDKDTGKTYSKGQKWMSDCSVVKCLAATGQSIMIVERRKFEIC